MMDLINFGDIHFPPMDLINLGDIHLPPMCLIQFIDAFSSDGFNIRF